MHRFFRLPRLAAPIGSFLESSSLPLRLTLKGKPMTSLTTHRRSFIKWLAAAPVLATIAGRELSNKLSAAVGKLHR